MKTIEKPIEAIRAGDVIETEDGFTLHHLRVSGVAITVSAKRTTSYEVYGTEDGQYGELYFVAGDLVEVVA
jgi:hypothetical protein